MHEPSPSPSGLKRVLGADGMLGSLVAIASVLVAFAAYQSNQADSNQADLYTEGQRTLSLSNTEFLRANQNINQDYAVYDASVVHYDDPYLVDFFESNFSAELAASAARPDGPFDDRYYDDMYAEADALFDEADALFAEGRDANQQGGRYQMAGLVVAVGLALAAWASILRASSTLRPVFVLMSLVVVVGGSVSLASTYLG